MSSNTANLSKKELSADMTNAELAAAMQEALKNGNQQATFFQVLQDIITNLDIDTIRFTELLWAIRGDENVPTAAFLEQVPDSEKFDFSDFQEFWDAMGLTMEFKSDLVWRGIVPNEDKYRSPHLMVFLSHYGRSQPFTLSVVGDKELVNQVYASMKDRFAATDRKKIQILTGVNADGSFVFHDRLLYVDEKNRGFDNFYPCIKDGVDKLVTDFEDSNANVLLLVGPPGTGKSTLLRTIFEKMDRKEYGICSNGQALESPNITGWLTSFGDDSIVALEDADVYIQSREKGNTGMSALLNLVDGVIGVKRKVIISTNLPSINDVDKALLRPGRMFRVITFLPLTREQADLARAEVGKDTLPTDVDFTSITLSEALNYDPDNGFTVAPARVIGMIPSK